MITLTDYVKKNRIKSKVEIETVNFGEMYPSGKAIYYDLPLADKTYKIFAFIVFPTTKMPKGGYPAVLLLHGGNGTAYYEHAKKWADNGFVAIAPDLNAKCGTSLQERGIENDKGGPCGYGYSGLTKKHPWTYFSVLSSMRAIDVLLSDERVNKDKIYSCGLSWGGFLNLDLLAFEKRIKAGTVIYSSAYAYDSDWGRKRVDALTEKEREEYIFGHDPKNYLSKIKVPILFTAGTDDIAFKGLNRQKTADGIKGKPYYAIRKSFYHGNFYGFEQPESLEFCKMISSGKVLPEVICKKVNNTVVVKPYKNSSKINAYYTCDDLEKTETYNYKKMKPISKNRYELNGKATAFFIEERTIDGLIWSSKVEIL